MVSLQKIVAAKTLAEVLVEARRIDPATCISLLYDRGICSYYSFEKHGIIVILPSKKQPTIIFSRTSQEGARDTAIIENLNESLNQYNMFGRVKMIVRINMAEHEFNATGFLVNLGLSINAWSSSTTSS